MKKKIKNNIAYPQAVSSDVLALWEESDLFDRMVNLENEKIQVLQNGYNPFSWEIELAWIQREVSIRKERKSRHEKFVADNATALRNENFSTEEDLNEFEFAN